MLGCMNQNSTQADEIFHWTPKHCQQVLKTTHHCLPGI